MPDKEPVFWRRKDYPDVIYRTVEAKLRAIVTEIVRHHVMGRPMLVGTTSVEISERLSNRLRAEPVRRLLQVLLIRRLWLEATTGRGWACASPNWSRSTSRSNRLDPDALRQFAKHLGLTTSTWKTRRTCAPAGDPLPRDRSMPPG